MDLTNSKTVLHNAVCIGNIPLLDKLLDEGADIDSMDNHDNTPLNLAVAYGNPLLVTEILYEGKIINVKEYKRKSNVSLHSLLLRIRNEMVSKLLNRGASPHVRNRCGNTPLHTAVCYNRCELIDKLLNIGAVIELKNNKGETPLDIAVMYGNLAAVIILINNGAKHNKHPRLIHTAVRYQNCSLINKLLDDGVNVDIRNDFEQTPLHVAVRERYCELAITLLDRGAEIDATDNDGLTPLYVAVMQNDIMLMDMLITRGARTDIHYFHGNSPFHVAVFKSEIRLVDELVDRGWPIDVTNEDGETPLHLAIVNCDHTIINRLLDQGANIDTKNCKGESPLFAFVNYIITENKKRQNVYSFSNHSAPSTEKLLSIVNLLLDRGADIDIQDNDGNTPLHVALVNNDVHLIKTLLDGGADIKIRNNMNQTPYDVAVFKVEMEVQLCKLALAGFPVNVPNFDIILNCLEIVNDKFKSELNAIKQFLVHDNISLNVVFSNHNNPYYLSNNQLQYTLEKLFQSSEFEQKFPLYGNMLKRTYFKSKEIYKLLDLATSSLSNLLTFVCPVPIEIVQEILKHTGNDTRRQIIKSGLYLAPSNISDGCTNNLPYLIKENLLDQYLSDSELKGLLKKDLD